MSKPTIDKLPNGLGTIFREQNNINVRFWDMNVPLTSSSGRISVNALGKIRTIMIQGAMSGDGYSGATREEKLADFIYEIESWVNNAGEQKTAIYTDSLGKGYVVDAVDWQWTRSVDDPNRLLYNLILKET